jgi:hypothetical protein
MSSIECLPDTNQSDSVPSAIKSTKCKRVGCENPSIEHPEWDGEYCSAKCLSICCK